jgi:hypothetical protein
MKRPCCKRQTFRYWEVCPQHVLHIIQKDKLLTDEIKN